MTCDDDQGSPEKLRKIISALRDSADDRDWAALELYKMYGGRLIAFMARCATRAEAEELVQDVFMRVTTRIAQFERGAEQFPAWFWIIAQRIRLDWLAARKIALPQEPGDAELSELPSEREADPAQHWSVRQMRDCVGSNYELFRQQFPERAHALSLLGTDQLAIQEIAQIIDRSYGATRQYLAECRKKLRQFLEPCRELLET